MNIIREAGKVYFIAALVSLGFLVLGVLFIFYTWNLNKRDTADSIIQAVVQLSTALDMRIRGEFAVLDVAADSLAGEDMADHDAVLSRLFPLFRHNTYTGIGLVSGNGEVAWVDKNGLRHYTALLAGSAVNRAFKGEHVLTNPIWSENSSLMVNYYLVPVYQNGSVVAVFFAADPEDELRKDAEHFLYAGKGLAHIIDRDGNYVVRSNSPLRPEGVNNIFEVNPGAIRYYKALILDDLSNGRTGYLEWNVYRQDRIAAYAPLSVNNWSVFYAVPVEQINAGPGIVTKGAVIIIAAAMAIFVIFVFMIRKINNKSRKVLEILAFEDSLTGVRNFQKLMIDAKKLLSEPNGNVYSVWYSDINGFRYVNDLFGRDVGDRLLRHWANYLEKNIDSDEMFGRMGADVFVSLRKYASREEMDERFQKEARMFETFREVTSDKFRVKLRTGVYLPCPEDGRLSLEDKLDRAKEAHKHAKKISDRFQIALYSAEMRDRRLKDTEMESKMNSALAGNEFKVYLQPKIDIQNGGHVMGMEALVRWISPEKGLIPPAEFIPLFENNGFIVNLDRYVFETACKEYGQYLLEDSITLSPPFMVLSVNVSKLSLSQPDFIDEYTIIKKRYGIPDGCVELEFTETLLLNNELHLQQVLEKAHENGFLCSLDDFGAGYSSLNVLKTLKVDVLKLDRMFFHNIDNYEYGWELVKCVISTAKVMGMKTVAEGIDVEDYVNCLRQIDCDAVQGYVFARPMPMAEFRQFAKDWHWTPSAVSGACNKILR